MASADTCVSFSKIMAGTVREIIVKNIIDNT